MSDPLDIAFLCLAVVALAVLIVVCLWRSDAAVLDGLLRTSDEARQEIIDRGLDEAAASDVYDAWYGPALAKMVARFPAYEDDFRVVEDPAPDNWAAQMVVIRRLLAKRRALQEARRQSG